MKKAFIVFSMLAAGFSTPAASGDTLALLDILFYPPDMSEVYPGVLAPDWPQELGLPPGAELAGSLVLADGSQVAAFSISRSPEEFTAAYVGELQAEGWALLGSEEGEDVDYEAYSFQQADGDLLSLVVYERDGPLTYGILIYYGSEAVAVLRTMAVTVNEMLSALIDVDILPAFEFPGAEAVDDVVSSIPLLLGQQTYHAVVTTEADAAAVRGSVEEALESAGWTGVSSGIAGTAAWSSYRTERGGAIWEAAVLVFPLEEGDSFFVTVHARRLSTAD